MKDIAPPASESTLTATRSREEEATHALNGTVVSRAQGWCLVIGFLFLIVSEMLAQAFLHRASETPADWVDVHRILPSLARADKQLGDRATPQHTLARLWHSMPLPSDMSAFEKELEEHSVIGGRTLRPVQGFLSHALGQGNEQVYLGRDGWLFYRPDIDLVCGRPFLDKWTLTKRSRAVGDATVEPTPRVAIVQFAQQLKERGIQLVIVPAPAKSMIHPEVFSSRFTAGGPTLYNPSWARFRAEIEAAGVWCFDPSDALKSHDVPAYLKTDTHWTPEGMERVAAALANELSRRIAFAGDSEVYEERDSQVTGTGDLAGMMHLPVSKATYAAEAVMIRGVVEHRTGMSWSPHRDAEVLLLGDSFTNIYSLESMGWGENAGFAERLSFHLRRPVDRIVRNDAGAHATRELLARDLARGRPRLRGKRVVVWEFAARELAFGDWRRIELRDGVAGTTKYVAPKPGETWRVRATIAEAAPMPPMNSPYKDLRRAVRLTDIERDGVPLAEGVQMLVYTLALRDSHRTAAARWRERDTVIIDVRNWDDVASGYEALRVSELGDASLELLDAIGWAEEVNR